MAVTLKTLCEKASYLYGMRVMAGNEGLQNIVQWVHSVEDAEVSGFLHGGELIFSTGIASNGEKWLLPFVKNLIAKKVSGLVINIGPYISHIPQEVIDYCNAMKFPLMDIPWKTRIVDITRDFCNVIISSEKEEEDIGLTLRNLAFFPGNIDKYIPALQSHNFDINGNFSIIAIKTELKDNNAKDKVEILYKRFICAYKKHWGEFKVDSVSYIVLSNFQEAEVDSLVSNLQALQYNYLSVNTINIAVGLICCSLDLLSKNYYLTSRLLTFGVNKKMSPLYYDKLGIKKLILAVDNVQILKSIYSEILLPLENYDNENGTDYMGFLKKYFDEDGSVKKVAEDTFVHRNTINYQLSKIKNILGNDMKTLDDRFKIMLAFQIKEFL